jgi:phosphoribosylamine--glycine ligase
MQSCREFHAWRQNAHPVILCPDENSYQLEYSKLYTKSVLSDIGIPTPDHEIITSANLDGYKKFIADDDKCVFKIDKTKMSFGYQTRIVDRSEDFHKILDSYQGWTDSMFVERYIEGRELSYHILINGEEFTFLGVARDFKKIYENDQGKNCGSSGCYSYIDLCDDNLKIKMNLYCTKIVKELWRRGIDYKGIMYIGIKIDKNGEIYILEINTRSGNPEFVSICQTIESTNVLKNLLAAAQGQPLQPIEFSKNRAVSINVLNSNYTPYYKDADLPDFDLDDNLQIIYFDPREFFNNYYCNITTNDAKILTSRDKIISYLNQQDLKNYRFRRDIHD